MSNYCRVGPRDPGYIPAPRCFIQENQIFRNLFSVSKAVKRMEDKEIKGLSNAAFLLHKHSLVDKKLKNSRTMDY